MLEPATTEPGGDRMTSRVFVAHIALALACAACGETGNAAQRGGGGMPPMPVKLATLTPIPISDTTEYLGVLKSRRQITIQPQVDGQLTKIFVKSGDVLEAG